MRNTQQSENNSERPVDALALVKGESLTHLQLEINICQRI